jgi:hypothetical protein
MARPPSVNTHARCSAIRLAQTHVVMPNYMAKEYFIQYPGFPKNLTDEQIEPRGASSFHHLRTCGDNPGIAARAPKL